MNKIIFFLLIALVAVQINAHPADPAKDAKKDAKGAEDKAGDAAKKAEDAAKKGGDAAKTPDAGGAKKDAGLTGIIPEGIGMFEGMIEGGMKMFQDIF